MFRRVGLSAPPGVNKARPGSAIDLKFSLGGNYGQLIVKGFPSAAPYTCGSTPPAPGAGDPFLPTTQTYDARKDQYTIRWATAKSYANSCYQVSVRLADGSVRTVLFQFK